MKLSRKEAEELARFIKAETLSQCVACRDMAEGILMNMANDGTTLRMIPMCRPCFNVAFTEALDAANRED